MIASDVTNTVSLSPDRISCLGEDMVELSFLLPEWQAAALEAAAHGRGLTAAQLMRRILREHFARFAQPSTNLDQ